MQTLPIEWTSSPIKVNLSSTGSQRHGETVGLSNGNFLVVYTDESGAVGSGSGADIVGVIYDALGNIVEPAFQVNSAGAGGQISPAIAATNDGGFVMVYTHQPNSGIDYLRIERYDQSGFSTHQNLLYIPPNEVNSASIAVDPSDNSMFFTYQYDDGVQNSIKGIRLDEALQPHSSTPAGGFGVSSDNYPNAAPGDLDPDTAVLSNGNYITVFARAGGVDGTDTGIGLTLTKGNNGSLLFGANIPGTTSNGIIENQPSVAALTGDKFVVVYREDNGISDDIAYAIYDNNQLSTPITVGTIIDTGANYAEPDVIGLEDGGFFVIMRQTFNQRLEGKRYDADGNQIGTGSYEVEPGNVGDPQLSLTTDGRILMSFVDELGDINVEILDPRDTTIVADPGDGQITSRPDTGTKLVGSDDAETLYGSAFNDVIDGGAGNDIILAADGDDFIRGGFGFDTINGGNGRNTIDISHANRIGFGQLEMQWNVNIGLGAQSTAELILKNEGLVVETDSLLSITRVSGSNWTDNIIGNSADNRLNGLNGNDVLYGLDGSDSLFGGRGSDEIFGGTGNDRIEGGRGDDRIFGNRGDDFIETGRGNDEVDGGQGFDTIAFGASTGGVSVDLELGSGLRNDADGDTYTSIEHIDGSFFSDSIVGNDVDNELNGLFSDDIIFGGGGDDIIQGAQGRDELYGQSGNDILLGGSENDKIFGNSGTDQLNGGAGNDQLTGGANGDFFVFETEGNSGFGGDIVFDFENNVDKLDVSGVYQMGNWAELADSFSDFTVTNYSNGVRVTFETGQEIFLDATSNGITVADIDESDFIFA